MSKSYKFRLEPRESQRDLFAKTAGCCRWVYNWGLANRIAAYDLDKSTLSYVDQANQLPALKKSNSTIWLSDVPSHCLQQSLKDLDLAYKNFFRRLKKGETPGFPRFKKKGDGDSFRLPDPKHIQADGEWVKLPKVGWVRFRKSREIEGRLRNVTITKSCDHWYISFNCEVEVVVFHNEGEAVGIDRGVTDTLTTSDDRHFRIPETIKKLEFKIEKAQRKLSRKVKGSSNRKKAMRRLSKLHEKLRNIRTDWLHKTSTMFAKNQSLIVLEKLQTRNMTQSASGSVEEPGTNVQAKSGLNRAILRQGWHSFETMLDYKSKWYGSWLAFVDPKNTSRRCYSCGFTDQANRKKKLFLCIECGHTEDADVNAAKNILKAVGHTVLACGERGYSLDESGTHTKVVS